MFTFWIVYCGSWATLENIPAYRNSNLISAMLRVRGALNEDKTLGFKFLGATRMVKIRKINNTES